MPPRARNPTGPRPHKARTSVARSLARPGDPLVLPDGRVIEEETDEPDLELITEKKGLRAPSKPQHYRASIRRVLTDLPTSAMMMRGVSVVFAYTMFGIGDVEICGTLNISPSDLKKIRAHQAYAELFDAILNEFVNANSDIIQARIQAYAHDALDTVGHLATKAKKEETRLSASKDILDRSGARPSDLVKSQAMQMNELRIVVSHPEKDVNIKVEMTNGRGEFSEFNDV